MPSPYVDRVHAATDAEGRLPIPAQVFWDVFPFDPDTLVVKPLDQPQLPEPPRAGEGGTPCLRCDDPEDGVVWSNANWVLTGFGDTGLPFAAMLLPRKHIDLEELDDDLAAELGLLIVRITRAARGLPDVGRVHVNKWGDGGAHLHVIFFGRPEGMMQLRGSGFPLWEDLLPRVPADESAAAVAAVAELLG